MIIMYILIPLILMVIIRAILVIIHQLQIQQTGNFSGLSFIVYDLLGKKIFKGNTSRIIDTSNLDKGIYLIEFSSSNQKVVRKIIKN